MLIRIADEAQGREVAKFSIWKGENQVGSRKDCTFCLERLLPVHFSIRWTEQEEVFLMHHSRDEPVYKQATLSPARVQMQPCFPYEMLPDRKFYYLNYSFQLLDQDQPTHQDPLLLQSTQILFSLDEEPEQPALQQEGRQHVQTTQVISTTMLVEEEAHRPAPSLDLFRWSSSFVLAKADQSTQTEEFVTKQFHKCSTSSDQKIPPAERQPSPAPQQLSSSFENAFKIKENCSKQSQKQPLAQPPSQPQVNLSQTLVDEEYLQREEQQATQYDEEIERIYDGKQQEEVQQPSESKNVQWNSLNDLFGGGLQITKAHSQIQEKEEVGREEEKEEEKKEEEKEEEKEEKQEWLPLQKEKVVKKRPVKKKEEKEKGRRRKLKKITDTTDEEEEQVEQQQQIVEQQQIVQDHPVQDHPNNHKRIVLSGYSSSEYPNKLNLRKVDIEVVELGDECGFDILVLKQVRRTYKFLYALLAGAHIVDHSWIDHALQNYTQADPARHIPHSQDFKALFGMHVSEVIQQRDRNGTNVFEGYTFYVDHDVNPSKHEVESLLRCGGGKISLKMQRRKNNKFIHVVATPQTHHGQLPSDAILDACMLCDFTRFLP